MQNSPVQLTLPQQSVYQAAALFPDLPLYNIGGYVDISGPLDPDLFLKALDQMVRQTDALRLRLIQDQGVAHQKVVSQADPAIFHNFSLQTNPQQAAIEHMEDLFVQPFQLENSDLFRYVLYKVNDTRWFWLMNYHHLIMDGYGASLIVRRVGDLYNQMLTVPTPRPATPPSYLDFAQDDLTYRNSKRHTADAQYWAQHFNAAPPLERQAGAAHNTHSHEARETFLHLDSQFYQRLSTQARSQKSSVLHMISAVLGLYFCRVHHRRNLCLGMPTHNRRGAFKHIPGMFVGMLPVVMRLDPDQTLVQAVSQLRADLTRHYRHLRYPIHKIQAQGDRPIDQPLYDVEISYETGDYDTRFGDAAVEVIPLFNGCQRAGLAVHIRQFHHDSRVRIDFDYRLSAFDPDEMPLLLERFRILLQLVLDQPHTPLKQFDHMFAGERHQLLHAFNAPRKSHGLALLHEIFSTTAAANPRAAAIEFEDQHLTYAALDQRANLLAAGLCDKGVGAETVVALHLAPSLHMITAILGVLKTGAAYLPLEPDLPADRLKTLLEDAQPLAVLHSGTSTAMENRQCINLDHMDWSVNTSFRPRPMDPQHPAYLIYTSGSTGRPKGVLVPHAAVANRIHWQAKRPEFSAADVVLQKTSYAFDVSVGEIFLPFALGAKLVIARPDGRSNPNYLAQLIADTGITIAHMVPGMLRLFLDTNPPPLPGLRHLWCSGETLAADLCRRFRSSFPSVTLENLYGPTEAAIEVSFHILNQEHGNAIPIGKPIRNVQLYIGTPDLQLQPIHEVGELLIGGDCLARGYLGRPDLTALAFCPDPFSAQPGARLYHSGDLARVTLNGDFHYLGRMDHQLKVRGYRIEPAEIETHILRHPSIRHCAVVPKRDAADVFLAAYLVTDDTSPDWHSYLCKVLPQYMIPSVFIALPELPRTNSGKLDRQALAAAPLTTHHTARPQSAVMQLLTQIWADVLDLQPGPDDNLFQLGGHSLSAVRIINRINNSFQLNLPPAHLFQHPTIARLAESLSTASTTPVAAVTPTPCQDPRPLSYAQERLWFLHEMVTEKALYNMPVLVELTGALNAEVLERALDRFCRRHHGTRTNFTTDAEGRPVQMVQPHQPFKLGRWDWSDSSEASIAAKLSPFMLKPFDLEQDPLFRADLFELSESNALLLVNSHHIITDGWSTELMFGNLSADYAAILRDEKEAVQPAETILQYGDYAVWQRQNQDPAHLQAGLSYWRRVLADAPQVLDLPTRGSRPSHQTFAGAQIHHRFDRHLTHQLQQLARQQKAGLFQILTAVFAELLARYTGVGDICLGTPTANRANSAQEEIYGLFVNTLVLRLQCADETAAARISAARDVIAGAVAHGGTPFEKIVDMLQPERDQSRPPLVQVMLAFEDQSQQPLTLPGIRAINRTVSHPFARFDLTLLLTLRDGCLDTQFEYNTDLFDPHLINGMARHLETLAQGFVRTPEQPAARLPILTQAEGLRIIHQWNQTARPQAQGVDILELFDRWTTHTPHAPAVIDPHRQLTFSELADRVDALTDQLLQRGIGHEKTVAVLQHRSTELVVSFLAILRAGGVYLPLDPDHPKARLNHLIEDADACLVLSHSRINTRVNSPLILLDQASPATATRRPPHCPQQTAYMIYTSGSTGRPKGVRIPRRGLAGLVQDAALRLNCGPGSRLLAAVPPTFDASIMEFAMSFLNGGAWYALEETTIYGDQIIDACRDLHITHMTVTPSVLATVPYQPLPKLHTLVVGGESCPPQLAEQWLQGRSMQNIYGPTESTVAITLSDPMQTPLPQHITIGRPLSNVQIYLLDRNMNPVPVGVAGELYVGSMGTASGYHRAAGQTAGKFIPNPFAHAPGQRLYRTGDLAAWTPSGELIFLGRMDHQVKIRGVRMELGEISARLLEHPAITKAIVFLHDTGKGQALAAALTGATVGHEQLRQFLRRHLTDTMIPNHFLFLDAMPLTANGKLDLNALTQMVDAIGSRPRPAMPPETPAQTQMCAIWALALGLTDPADIDADFFQLGGHSLTAARVATLVRSRFKRKVSVRDLFDHPTIRGLCTFLEQRQQQEAWEPKPRANPHEPAPLSFAQARLWFLDRFQGGGTSYHMPFALRLDGPLDVGALNKALTQITARHHILRTRFVQTPTGDPAQVVDPAQTTDLQPIHPQGDPLEHLLRDAAQPFDLERGPLFRVTLYRVEAQRHLLLINTHHIISDGWSLGVIMRELAAFLAGQSPAALPVQYADYASWQRLPQHEQQMRDLTAWWSDTLADVPGYLNLPSKGPRPSVQTTHGASLRFPLNPEVTARFQNLAHTGGFTPFMIHGAVLAEVLGRYTGARDLCLGVPSANRDQAAVSDLIGFFVNTLVIRVRRDVNASVLDQIQQMRGVTTAAYEHGQLPFEQLVETLQPQRDTSITPLFQVLLTQTENLDTQLTPDLRAQAIELPHDTAKFDLSLILSDNHALLEYNTDLFEKPFIQRLAHHFNHLAAAWSLNPGHSVAGLSMLTPAERSQWLETWNHTSAPPSDAGLQQLIQAAAERFPQNTAITHGEQRLTYAELAARSDTAAAHLQAKGVTPGQIVAVAMARCLDLPVALLGILKTGAAYLPLDLDLPPTRLQYMVNDANAALMVTTKDRPLFLETTTLFTDQLEPATPAAIAFTPCLPAYLIYTSGSTGKPKGVLVSHRAVVNRLLWMQSHYPFGSERRVLQKTSYSFDVSVWEFFLPLISGARLVSLAAGAQRSTSAITAAIQSEGVTDMHMVPGMLEVFLETLPPELQLPSLKQVFCSGEALKAQTRDQFFARFPGLELHNLYGPTEAAVDVSYHACRVNAGPMVPIGRPISNVQLYVACDDLQLQPIGVNGQLLIGGIALAAGYLNRPDLTAAAFIPNPFGKIPGSRLYCTGDLTRIRENGCIDYMGRMDFQVKIRGYRIELGEIENALQAHPTVTAAAVLPSSDQSALEAVITGVGVSVSELKDDLSLRLPEYMVPGNIIVVSEMPRSANGKLDRNQLHHMLDTQKAADRPHTPAADLDVDLIAGVMAAVLNRPQALDGNDNFFDLGGHSLSAIRLTAHIQQAMNKEISVRDVFTTPTARGLANLLRNEQTTAVTAPMPREDCSAPLSFAQQRLWFLEEMGAAVYNMPAAIRLQGPLDTTALEAALNRVISRHDILRMRITESIDPAGTPQQTVQAHQPFQLNRIDLTKLPALEADERIAQLVQEYADKPFDLYHEPPLRIALLIQAPDTHILLLTLHHLAADGLSIAILASELSSAYEKKDLGDLPLQYGDYAAWQRNTLDRAAIQPHLDWWQTQLTDAPDLINLPAKGPRPADQTHNGADVPIHVNAALTAELQQLAAQTQATLFLTLGAVFSELLARYGGDQDLCLGTPVANRRYGVLEPLIGLFVNTLVLRVRRKACDSLAQHIARLRHTTLDAFEHQDAPFEKLVDLLQPIRRSDCTPLFQVMFAFQNVKDHQLSLPGITTQYLPPQTISAKFDLTLALTLNNGEINGALEYNTDLYSKQLIQAMARHFCALLRAAVTSAAKPIAAINMLDQNERRQLLDWANGAPAFDFKRDIPQLLADHATRNPNMPALIDRDRVIDYQQFFGGVQELAAHLLERGVTRETRVALLLPPSADLATAVCAVLHCGGVCVPLAALPDRRLQWMLSQTTHLITTQELNPTITHDAEVILINQHGSDGSISPAKKTVPNQAAYIIYTSGTTGVPKGVVVTRHALLNKILDHGRRFELKPGYRHLVSAGVSFDPIFLQLLCPLMHGGTVVLPGALDSLDADRFWAVVDHHKVDVVNLTPSVFAGLLPARKTNVHKPKHLILGGEKIGFTISTEVAERVWNAYGPTETTIDAVFSPVSTATNPNQIPIGAPTHGMRAHVLDTNLDLLPSQAQGQLYLAGLGLARGYLGRPDLTAVSFVPNPFSNQPGARLYRTGDLVRRDTEGNLYFLRRVDNQLKIRGVRLESAEIETVLSDHAAVNRSMVFAHHTQLIAAVSGTVSADELRRHCRERLPQTAVPSVFVFLELLPLSASGKLDRTRCHQQALQQMARTVSRHPAASLSTNQRMLRDIWASVLKREPQTIDVQDNFFELGGDSIIALQVAARARRAGMHLTPRLLFKHQTIKQLTPHIAKIAATVQTAQETGPFNLSPIQHDFFQQPGPHHHYNQSVCLQLPQPTEEARLQDALQKLQNRHAALRLIFPEDGKQHHLDQALVQLQVFPMETDLAAQMERLGVALHTGLNPVAGPLFAAALIQSNTVANRLLLVFHHLIVDGVSLRIILEDLYDLYQTQPPAPTTSSFRDWVHHLEEAAQSPRLKAETTYWQELTRNQPTTLETGLAADHRSVKIQFDADLTTNLLERAQAAYHTEVNHLLVTALALALSRAPWPGWDPANGLIHLEGHGRESDVLADYLDGNTALDLSRTVGWFTLVYPVRLPAACTDIGQTLIAVKERLRSIPNKGLGYSILRRFSPETIPPIAPVVAFNYLGRFHAHMGAWKVSDEPHGDAADPHRANPFALEINGAVLENRLQFQFNAAVLSPAALQRTADHFQKALVELVRHCLTPGVGAYTASDFPLARPNPALLATLQQTYPAMRDLYPLSPLQQGLHYLAKSQPDSDSYLVQLALHLRGPLDPEQLETAWNGVLQHFDALSIAIPNDYDHLPLQVVTPTRVPFQVLDWRGKQDPDGLSLFLKADRERPFDFSQPPLLRVTVLQLSADHHIMVLTNHHILMDGWSLPIVMETLFTLYRDADAQLPPTPSYGDHISLLQSRDQQQGLNFWRHYLADFDSPTPVPGQGDHCGSDSSVHQCHHQLSQHQTDILSAHVRRSGLTLSLLCQAAWAILLSRYSGERDIVFGITVSGRSADLPNAERGVGLYINTLPVRMALKTDTSAAHLIELRDSRVAADEHQYVPLNQIQAQTTRHDGKPLFETLLVFENYPVSDRLTQSQSSGDLTITDVIAGENTHYPLTLICQPGATLGLRLDWRGPRLQEVDAQRLLGHMTQLLAGLAATPEVPPHELAMLTPDEQHCILNQWNQTQTSYAQLGLHQLFNQQAKRTPRAPAHVFEGETQTYAQLQQRSAAVARHLLELGVRPGETVALALERCLDLPAALLGVLIAGAAYLPLDPDLPEKRLQFMTRDSGARLVLSTAAVLPDLPELTPVLLDLDLLSENPEAPDLSFEPLQPAYVIYTSGSTGKPKGVVVPHGAVSNRIQWMQGYYHFRADDVFLQKTPYSFDVSVWEFFQPLIAGATLVSAKPDGHRDPEYLANLIHRQHISVVHMVPGMLEIFLEAVTDPASLTSLKRVFCSGEALTAKQCRDFFQRFPNKELHNHYGPTEAAIEVTHHRRLPSDMGPVPIGKPIDNITLHVVSPHLQLQPVGVIGELLIGGVAPARGYQNQPDLTAAVFIPDPFSKQPGSRLYRTGDLARFRTDGIDYLGRRDSQVKIRGFRIELGEIEAALTAAPDLTAAVAFVDHGNLIAVVTGTQSPSELRAHLSRSLPQYMIPAGFVFVDALPLSTNGKVDRKQCRRLGLAKWSQSPTKTSSGPTTPAERLLQQLWTQLLAKNGPVDLEDNFFELGGDSIIAMQIVTRARRENLSLEARDFFTTPTIRSLAPKARRLSYPATEPPPLPNPAPGIMAQIRQRFPDHEDVFPLSANQEGLLFHHRMADGDDPYFLVNTSIYDGDFDPELFIAAWDKVQNNHPVLRTAMFYRTLEQPLQVVLPQAPFHWDRADWTHMTDEQQQEHLRKYLKQQRAMGFDLEQAPLMRFGLFQTGRESHTFVSFLHHIIVDGWSVQILLRDLFQWYRILDGEDLPQPQAPRPFRDHIAGLTALDLDQTRDYWRRQLAGFVEAVPLPTEKTTGAEAGFGNVNLDLDHEHAAAFHQFVRHHGLTWSALIHAVWSTILSRFSNRTKVCFGATVSGRPETLTGVEHMTGLFFNSPPVMVELPESGSLAAFIKDLAVSGMERERFSFTPLVTIQNWSEMPAGESLFRSLVVLDNYPVGVGSALENYKITLRSTQGDHRTHYPLTLLVSVNPHVALRLSYDQTRFTPAGAALIMSCFRNLLDNALQNPAVTAWTMTDKSQRKQLLTHWNQSPAGTTPLISIAQRIFNRVLQTPDAVALEAEGQSWTYDQLLDNAFHWRDRLIQSGFGVNQAAAIDMDRSPRTMFAVLGVHLAGGAWLPLNPKEPPERLKYLLEDAAPAVLITSKSNPTPNIPVLDLHAPLPNTRSKRALPQFSDCQRMYVMYTSGSTGNPKGVAMAAGPIAQLIADQLTHMPEPARTLQFAAPWFDVSVQELFLTWSAGGTLLLINDQDRRDPSQLIQFLNEHRVERLFLPFAALQQLAGQAMESDCSPIHLRQIITAGEQLQMSDNLIRFMAAGKTTLINQYGPTETHVATAWTSHHPFDQWPILPPIGRPVQGATVYVLDRFLQPVPAGVTAMLYLGGHCLAEGYYRKPDLTAAAFIPDPYGKPGDRLYRTGDLAHFDFNGVLHFAGRADHQIKLRGFRVEPGEIESLFTRRPDIEEAVVTIHTTPSGNRFPVAYLVGAKCSETVLRAFTADHLPDYMQPTFVFLDRLPLTGTGKVNRRALPGPELNTEYVQTGNAAHTVILGVWSDVLGMDAGDPHADFFDLGGHSLLVTRVVSRLRQIFDRDLSLRDFFQNPTAAKLADLLTTTSRHSQPQITAVTQSNDLAPLSYAQQRLWILDHMGEAAGAYNVHGLLLIHGALDVERLQTALDRIVMRHQILRTTFHRIEGQPRQKIHPAASVRVHRHDLSGSENLIDLAAVRAAKSFDLAKEPPLEITLYGLSPNEHALLINMHHLICDGWSLDIMLREFTAFYDFQEPQPLAIQFADYAIMQREQWDLQSGLTWWREQLRQAPELLPLPTDRRRPGVQTYNGATTEVTLDICLSHQLQQLARRGEATLHMVLLAVFNCQIACYTQSRDICVGAPVANRNRRELEPLIGFFANTLVLRNDLSGDPEFLNLLHRVRTTALAAYDMQDIPFELVVEAVNPTRNTAYSPLFQVMFTFQNQALTLPAPSDLTWEAANLPSAVAKFDLSLILQETGNGICGVFEYNSDLFDSTTMAQFAAHFVQLAERVAADPEKPISTYSPISADERLLLLQTWNDTQVASPPFRFVHQLIADQAARHPSRIAALIADREGDPNHLITYRDLSLRACALAQRLRFHGVGREVVVAVLGKGSPLTLVAMLAVQEAGGVFLPLDPDEPKDRLDFMLKDSRTALILTESAAQPVYSHIPHLAVEIDTPQQTHQSHSQTLHRENSAYLIYTSGTTGRPKAVQVSHGAFAGHCKDTATHTHQLSAADVVLQFAPVHFDACLEQIFPALITGCRLIQRTGMLWNGEDLQRILTHYQVTVANLPSAYHHQIMNDWHRRRVSHPASLRLWIVGGEAISIQSVRHWFALSPTAQLINAYGPTEASVTASFHKLTKAPTEDNSRIPIGQSGPNRSAFVLDSHLNLCPIGVVGELYLSGSGLARGYFQRPALTAQSFIPNPFQSPNNVWDDRLYRTGDLVRRRADGVLDILGRTDQQLKIRGYRVEPDEIASRLAAHPYIHNAVVSSRSIRGANNLIAWYEADHELSRETLNRFLHNQLPHHMIPTIYVFLSQIPLTSRGKVDVQALPNPPKTASLPQREHRYQGVLALWEQVLGRTDIGINDNFFESGGNSLLMISLQALIQERYNKQIGLVELFAHPTVSTLAAILETDGQPKPMASVQTVKPTSVDKARQRAGKQRQNMARQRQAHRKK